MLQRNWSSDVVAIGDHIAALTGTEANMLTQYLADTYGIEADNLIVTPPPEPDLILENDDTEPAAYDVVLEGFQAARKIHVIKAMREQLGLGIVQARDVIESVPQVLRERLPRAEAEQLRGQLEAAGAKASLQPCVE